MELPLAATASGEHNEDSGVVTPAAGCWIVVIRGGTLTQATRTETEGSGQWSSDRRRPMGGAESECSIVALSARGDVDPARETARVRGSPVEVAEDVCVCEGVAESDGLELGEAVPV